MSNIKLGITLYSFTPQYAKGIFSLEDCIRTAKEMGAEGFEMVGTQMLPSYPFVSEQFLREIKAISEHYDIKLICYDANMDRGMMRSRNLTEDEMLSRAINDIKSARKLGCDIIREQFLMSPEAMRRVAPYAEAYGVKVGIEIHNPEYPTSPIMKEYTQVYEEVGSEYIGFIPDFGCFATKPNKPAWDMALKNGAKLEHLELAAKLRYDEVDLQEAREIMQREGANEATMSAFQGMYGFMTFYNEPDLEGLKKIMKHCFLFHGKFHYVSEDLHEASIPYEKVLNVIKESDFDGYVMSEYEDHDSDYASLDMVRRHIQMERKILGGTIL